VHAGAGAYICGEETALLDSLEGAAASPGCGRRSRRSPASTPARRWSTTSSRSPRVPYIVLGNGADWFRRWAPRSPRASTIYSLSGHVASPGQYEAPLGITLRELLDWPAACARATELKFWTPGGSSTPLLTAEHLDVPLDFEGVARPGRCSAPRRCRSSTRPPAWCAAVLRWTEFYAARVLRQVHAVPRGHVLAGADPARIEAGKGTEADLDTLLDICDNINGRSFCALGDGAASPITSSIKYFRDEYLDYIERGAARSTRPSPPSGPTSRFTTQERMTVTMTHPREAGRRGADLVTAHHRRDRGQRPQGHAGHPGRRADRHRDPAVLRPPAARPGRRLPPVPGRGRGPAQADASCTHCTVADGMVVKTQLTSPVADKAQQGVMELLLINHPLDCPVCDKGGECPLQNQAMSNGRGDSRFDEQKRTFPKPIPSPPRCCWTASAACSAQRCTRFSEQIAGDPFIELMERGALQQVGTATRATRSSRTSPATPSRSARSARSPARVPVPGPPVRPGLHAERVRALRGRLRERTDHRRGKVMRRLAGDDPAVNEEWNCDKGRFAFRYATAGPAHHPAGPRRETASCARRPGPRRCGAAEGLAAARGGVGVLTGGRLTVEDAYAYAKFARVALGTNDIDFRARPHSAEEADFLAAHVAGRGRPGRHGLTYADAGERARGAAGRVRARGGVARSSSCGCARHASAPSPSPPTPAGASRRRAAPCCPPRRAPRPSGWTRSRAAPGWTRTVSGPPRRCARRARSSSSASGWRRWRAD
jgi:hypothetical protein